VVLNKTLINSHRSFPDYQQGVLCKPKIPCPQGDDARMVDQGWLWLLTGFLTGAISGTTRCMRSSGGYQFSKGLRLHDAGGRHVGGIRCSWAG
jgi:hypothetical protein